MLKAKFSSLVSKISYFSDHYPIFFPLALLALALISYGIFISSLGFYWDDWPPILLSHVPDKTMVWTYFTYDRPFQSWTYYLLFPICRDSAFLWQLSAILARWSSGLALFYAFLLVLPRQKFLLQWAAFLFVVFPGFADQYASVAYGSHFMVYTIFGLSLLFMVLAVKKPKIFWLFFPLSLIFTCVHLFTMEYFVGLELLRPLLLYWLFLDQGQAKVKSRVRTIQTWLPYLVVLGIYLYWRMAIYPHQEFGLAQSNYPYIFENFIKSPVATLELLFQSIYSDLHFLFADIWASRVFPAIVEFKSLPFWFSIFIGIGVAYILNLFFHEEPTQDGLQLSKTEIGRNILLSCTIIFFGLFPIWSSLRQVTVGKWSDRFDIPVIYGVTIFIITLLFIIVSKSAIRKAILILIVGLSISFQIQTGNIYRKDYYQQKNFYTQLAWRIPGLEPGTTIFAPGIPTNRETDYSYSMGVNLLFNTGTIDSSLDYWFFTPRYFDPADLTADPTIEMNADFRFFKFQGIASKVVSIRMSTQGCLWVIDHYYAIYPEKIDQFYYYGELTNQNLIKESGKQTNNLSKIFDTNPQNTWCYFFEKGDLAQSKGKYKEAVQLYEQAVNDKLIPLEAIEYLPFVKSYLKLGRIDEAVALTRDSFKRETLSYQPLCQVWHDALKENPEIPLNEIDSVYNSDICKNLEP